MNSRPSVDPAAILTEEAASAHTSLSRRSLARYRAEGGGPAFVRLGPGRIGYRRGDLDAWLDARRFASTSAEARGLVAQEAR